MEFNVEDRVIVSGELFADGKPRDFMVSKIVNGILYLYTPDLQTTATQGSALYYELSEVEPDGVNIIELQLPQEHAGRFLTKRQLGGRRRRTRRSRSSNRSSRRRRRSSRRSRT